MSAGFDRPSRVAVARALAALGAEIKESEHDAGNYERDVLSSIVRSLVEEPPNLGAALKSAEDGVAHAFRGAWIEHRIEGLLCCAVYELLQPVGSRA